MFSNPLVKEITVVLVLKLAFITALWFAFFRGAPEPLLPITEIDRSEKGPATELRASPTAVHSTMHIIRGNPA